MLLEIEWHFRYWKAVVAQVADLKLLADAVIASGVNQIVWHGMPYNAAGCHHEFYASVHVGPDCAFVAELPAFNAYLEKVCGLMQSGRTVSELAVYLPNEDMWMRGSMPRELRTPGAVDWWEMRHVVVPDEARPFQPLWVSASMLARAELDARAHSRSERNRRCANYISTSNGSMQTRSPRSTASHRQPSK